MGSKRLKKSLAGKFRGDFHSWIGEDKVGSPPHGENPYAFKVYSFEKVRGKYEQVLWLDSSIWLVKPIFPIFKIIGEKGYFMEEAGHWLGRWINEKTLKYYGITREEAMKIPMFSAGVLGLDFTNKKAKEFYRLWKSDCEAGLFVGDHRNHRHDMTCASFRAYQLGMKFERGGTHLAYIGKAYGKPPESACLHLQGWTG
jgi:hypothetical protein